MITTQRSQLETYESCPRRAYWNYYFEERGIERRALSVPLLTGSLIHQPLAHVLTHVKETGKVPPRAYIEEAIRLARTRYLETVASRGILLDTFDGSDSQVGQVVRMSDPTSPDIAWQVNEQLALIEALVKGWCKVRLPKLLEEYRVVDVEQEQQVELDESGVVFLTRRDGLLERYQTGEGFVLSFKSTKAADQTWIESHRYDMQTMSEFVAAAASYPSRVCRGVLLEGLVKGVRSIKWPPDADPEQKRHNSPLLYHWVEPAALNFPGAGTTRYPRSYSASEYRKCPAPHPWKWAKGGQCPGDRNHKLGEGWRRDMVSQTCGIDDWLGWLETNEPQLLQAQFPALPAIIRSDYEIARWKRQTIKQAEEMFMVAEGVRLGESIDKQFPMYTGHQNCLRPSRCPYLDLCWGSADPHDTDQYIPRTYNHPAEEGLRRRR